MPAYEKIIKDRIQDIVGKPKEGKPTDFIEQHLSPYAPLWNYSILSKDKIDKMEWNKYCDDFVKQFSDNDYKTGYIKETDLLIAFYENTPDYVLEIIKNELLNCIKATHGKVNMTNIVGLTAAVLQKTVLTKDEIQKLYKKIPNFDHIVSSLELTQVDSGYTNFNISENLKQIYDITTSSTTSKKAMLNNKSLVWCVLDNEYIKNLAKDEILTESNITSIVNNTPYNELKEFLFDNIGVDYGGLNFPLTKHIESEVYQNSISVYDVPNPKSSQISRALQVVNAIIKADTRTLPEITLDLCWRYKKEPERYQQVLTFIAKHTKRPEIIRLMLQELDFTKMHNMLSSAILSRSVAIPDNDHKEMAKDIYFFLSDKNKDVLRGVSSHLFVPEHKIKNSKHALSFVINVLNNATCDDELYEKILKDKRVAYLETIAKSPYTPEKYNDKIIECGNVYKLIVLFKEGFKKHSFGSQETMENYITCIRNISKYGGKLSNAHPNWFVENFGGTKNILQFKEFLSELHKEMIGTKYEKAIKQMSDVVNDFLSGHSEKKYDMLIDDIVNEFCASLEDLIVIHRKSGGKTYEEYCNNISGSLDNLYKNISETKSDDIMLFKRIAIRLNSELSSALNCFRTFEKDAFLTSIIYDNAEKLQTIYSKLEDILMSDVEIEEQVEENICKNVKNDTVYSVSR